jgi:molybdopterin synthase catalytic subunit
MRVQVSYFGLLKEVACATEVVELPNESTVGDLIAVCVGRHPKVEHYTRSLAVAVNCEYAHRSAVLSDGDEVGLLPPVSGGLERLKEPFHARTALVRDRIDSERVVSAVKRRQDGAVVVFDGIVRDNSRGRRTLYLDYEAYEAMALKELESLAAKAIERFAVRDVAVVHRLGRIEIGESSVLIVVASAHRAAAFEACRWIIDTLKTTVPIWKKEYFEDGAVWADGEPFPADIASN